MLFRSTVPVVAGFIGEVRQWRKFEKAWQRILRRAGITTIHTHDLMHSEKEFEGAD